MMPVQTHVDAISLSSAIDWLKDVLTGPAATTIAILGVASIGFLMLTGRTDLRRAARVIIGCFILFSASAIASGIVGTLQPPPPPSLAPEQPPAYAPSVPKPTSADPFPGASIPAQRTQDVGN
jgi:type IV secretory pathway VirB2 component (pilin)